MKKIFSRFVLMPLILISGIVFLLLNRDELRILSNLSFIDISLVIVFILIILIFQLFTDKLNGFAENT